MSFDRRKFLKALGLIAFGGIAGYGASEVYKSFKILKEEFPQPKKGKIEVKNSLCTFCLAGCLMDVLICNGNVIKVKGSLKSPLNGEGLCPVGVLNPVDFYHKLRLSIPLKKGKPYDLEKAVGEIKISLDKKKKIIIIGEEPDIVFIEILKFLKENYDITFYLNSPINPRKSKVLEKLVGKGKEWIIDYERANGIFYVGDGFFERLSSPVWIMKNWAEGKELYSISPKSSLVSLKSKKSVGVDPEKEDLAILSIIYLLLNEKKYDLNIIRNHTINLEKFNNFLNSNFSLDKFSNLVGIPMNDIIELSNFISQNLPLIFYDYDKENTKTGFKTASYLFLLNFILGKFNSSSGISIRDEEFFNLNDIEILNLDDKGIENLKSADILFFTSPPEFLSLQKKIKNEIEKIPLKIGFSTHMEDFFSSFDYLLPLKHSFESYVIKISPPNYPHTSISISSPLFDNKSLKSLEEYFKLFFDIEIEREEVLYKFREKTPIFYGSDEELKWKKMIKESGFFTKPVLEKEKYILDLLERGGAINYIKFPKNMDGFNYKLNFEDFIYEESPALYSIEEINYPFKIYPIKFSIFKNKIKNLDYLKLLNYAQKSIYFSIPALINEEDFNNLKLKPYKKILIETKDHNFYAIAIPHPKITKGIIEIVFAPSPFFEIENYGELFEGKVFGRCNIKKI